MNVQNWQIEIERAMAWYTVVSIAFTIIGFWILYAVLKAAIRDGINESNMGRPALGNKQPAAPIGYKWALVKDEVPMEDIRATR